MRERAQLSLPVVEAGIGVLFVVAVATAFAFGVPEVGVSRHAQLDAYAQDAATVLGNEAPSHGEHAARGGRGLRGRLRPGGRRAGAPGRPHPP